jgi:hypothetical protein
MYNNKNVLDDTAAHEQWQVLLSMKFSPVLFFAFSTFFS